MFFTSDHSFKLLTSLQCNVKKANSFISRTLITLYTVSVGYNKHSLYSFGNSRRQPTKGEYVRIILFPISKIKIQLLFQIFKIRVQQTLFDKLGSVRYGSSCIRYIRQRTATAPHTAFHIFNQQIFVLIFLYMLLNCPTPTKCHWFHNVIFLGL
jgi:hypothetical protein